MRLKDVIQRQSLFGEWPSYVEISVPRAGTKGPLEIEQSLPRGLTKRGYNVSPTLLPGTYFHLPGSGVNLIA